MLLALFLIIGFYSPISAQNPACASTFTAASGVVEDGSGSLNYANNLNCAYVIQPPQATSITLTFTQFNLASGDVLRVIRGASINGGVIAEFRMGSAPSVLNVEASAVTLHFITDASSVAQGWALNYTSTRANCGAPQNLRALRTGSSDAFLEWDPVPGAIAYEAEFRLPGGTWTALPLASTNSINVTGLQPGTTYQSWVRAICQGGVVSSWSSGVLYTTQGAAPTCTLGVMLKVRDITATTATAVWDFGPNYPAKTLGGKKYELQVRCCPRTSSVGTSQDWSSIIFESNSYTLTNLEPNTEYQVRGRVICDVGDTSQWSGIETFRTLAQNICQPPSNFKVQTVEEDNAVWVQVSWDPAPNLIRSQNESEEQEEGDGETQAGNKYQVSIRRTGINFIDTDWTNIVTTGTKLLIPQLVANQEYLFRVRTICSETDSSSFTPPVAFVTPPFLGPKNERLCFETDKTAYSIGEEIILTVTVSNIILALNSIQPIIRYDNRYLEFISIRRGNFFPGFAALNPIVNPTAGTIRFDVAGNEPRIGSGALATLTFRVTQTPPTTVDARFSLIGASATSFTNEEYELFMCPDIIARINSNCSPASLAAPGGSTSCQGNAVLLTASPGISYLWYRNNILLPNQVSQQLAATEPGEYRVSVISAPNCQPSLSNPILVSFNPAPLIQELRSLPASNENASDGSITISASGGLTPYRYSISLAGTAPRVIQASGPATFNNLPTGNYIVTVEDAARCVVSQNITVRASNICPTARIDFSSNYICSGSSLTLSANTGNGFRYQWFRNNQPLGGLQQSSLTVSEPGVYSVVITVENSNCPPSASQPVTISVGPPIQVESNITNASGPFARDGSISLNVSGGMPPYTLQIGERTLTSFGPAIFSGLAPGAYTLFLRDNANCTRSFSYTVGVSAGSGGESGCNTPSIIGASPVSASGALISWQPVASAVCYIVSYGPLNTPEAQWAEFLVPHPTASITIDGLARGNYGVKLRSNCTLCSSRSGVSSGWSSPRYFSLFSNRLSGQETQLQVSAYPNPSDGKFTVSYNAPKAENVKITLIDLAGKIVKRVEWFAQEGPNSHNLEHHTPGVYLLKLERSQGACYVAKIIIQ
jgi:hypothetical protein